MRLTIARSRSEAQSSESALRFGASESRPLRGTAPGVLLIYRSSSRRPPPRPARLLHEVVKAATVTRIAFIDSPSVPATVDPRKRQDDDYDADDGDDDDDDDVDDVKILGCC